MGTKISEFQVASTLSGTEDVPVVQSNSTVRTNPDAIAARTLVYAATRAQSASSLTVSSPTAATTPAVKITQLGTASTAHALVVQDDTDPDSTSFFIANDGTTVIGDNEIFSTALGTAKLQITGGSAPVALVRYSDTSTPIGLEFARGKASQGIVTDGLSIGRILFSGSDGVLTDPTAQKPAAYIDAEVDGTPEAGSVPGRLIFRTTAVSGTGPSERLRITNAGRVLLGGAGTESIVGGVTPRLQLQGANTSDSSIAGACYSASAATSSGINFARSKSATVGSFGAVASGDRIGQIQFYASTGTAWDNAGYIIADADGAPTATDVPMALRFGVTKTGGTSPTDVMRIDSSGYVGINTTSPDTQLEVVGSGAVIRATGSATDFNGFQVTLSSASATQGVVGFYDFANELSVNKASIAATVLTSGGSTLEFKTTSDGVARAIDSKTTKLTITQAGNIYGVGGSSSMVNGFICIPSGTAAPTGTPSAEVGANRAPMYFDRTNFRLYIHTGTVWKSVLLA